MSQIGSLNSLEAKSTTYISNLKRLAIDNESINGLKEAANKDPFRRARICLHQSHEDHFQSMVIALKRDSFVKPHRQLDLMKLYQVIEGEFILAFFDENGTLMERIEMGHMDSRKAFIYRFSSSIWHTIIPKSDVIVYVETIEGPYLKEKTEFAHWGPGEDDLMAVKKYRNNIINYQGNNG